jgi:hypothetical protein
MTNSLRIDNDASGVGMSSCGELNKLKALV